MEEGDQMRYRSTGEVILTRQEKWRMEDQRKALELNLDHKEHEIQRLQAQVEELQRRLRRVGGQIPIIHY